MREKERDSVWEREKERKAVYGKERKREIVGVKSEREIEKKVREIEREIH